VRDLKLESREEEESEGKGRKRREGKGWNKIRAVIRWPRKFFDSDRIAEENRKRKETAEEKLKKKEKGGNRAR